MIKEYEVYEPLGLDFAILAPDDQFDKDGFDRNAKLISTLEKD